jgi:hypothetical protein
MNLASGSIVFLEGKADSEQNNILKPGVMKSNTEYWNEKKAKLRKKYKNLTDKDLSYDEGNEKEMMEILGIKLGKSKQELLKIIITL